MIKEIDANSLNEAVELVDRVFSEFVAVEYSDNGIATFNEYIYDCDLLSKNKMWGFYEGIELAGVIATRDIAHISLLFVDKRHHRKGIAKQLLHAVVSDVTARSDNNKIDVNASPYAVNIYERMGFVRTSEKQVKDGIAFFPMVYSL